MTIDPDNPARLSASILEAIDCICLEFEQAWLRQERPAIRPFWERGNGQTRAELLRELLLLDIDYRRRRGEHPQPEEYVHEFPHAAQIVQSAFAAAPPDTINEQAAQAVESTHHDPSREPPAPSSLGRYRIDERIGVGGFGAVYRAYDEQLQRHVAVKVPHRERLLSTTEKEQFLQEARLLATLRHPGIVPVYDVGLVAKSDSACFVVSQYMDGGNLADYMTNHRPTTSDAVQIVMRMAEALHYAHDRGIVHRDVKASNILRDAEGNVYIADFGLALREDDIGSGVRFAGTPVNMSPEQARGEAHLVDGRTDVYGLGVVLYELLTGKRPFDSQSMTSLLEQIAIREPKPPRQIDDDIPRELDRICLKALSKRPTDRYSTAMDMARDLRHFERRRATTARAHAKILLSAGAVVAALALLWLIVGPRQNSGPRRRDVTRPSSPIRSLAVLPFRPIVEDERSAYVGLGMADTLVTRLSNLRQVVVRPTEAVRDYVHSSADPVAVGRKLGVDAVLAGSIQQTADQIRTSVRLLRVADGQSLWAATFDEASGDFFAVQDAISWQVANALAGQLAVEEQQRIGHRHTESRPAYEAYIKGRYYWNQRVVDGPKAIRKAIEYFKQAINIDPLYALAYAGLAESYALLNGYQGTLDEEAFPRARAAAKKALEIDGALTEAHATLAYVTLYHDWDWKRAEGQFRRAIELNPNYATAYQWYGELLYFSERFDEAITQLKRAAELDPLSPTIKGLQGAPYMWRRDYQRAREEYSKAEKVYPGAVVTLHGLAVCYEQESRFDKALESYRKQGYRPGQAYALAKMGHQAKALELLNELLAWGPHKVYPYHVATIHTGLGNMDEAFEWLEKARQARDEHMVWLKVDSKLDPLRDDPRFNQLLRDVGWTK